MENAEGFCQCACGARDFQVRLKRDEQVGLLTCSAGHHSLLLDSREHWADVLQDGRPKINRCRCRGNMFRVNLRYEFRQNGDVRTIRIEPICSVCGLMNTPTEIDIKYSPTDQLVTRPLDPIEGPWQQPKRHQITGFWKPTDAEKFASYVTKSLHARVFAGVSYEFTEVTLADIEFYPELKQYLLFTNIADVIVPQKHDPERCAPFLLLTRPYDMLHSFPRDPRSGASVRLLHLFYIKYSYEIVRDGRIEKQSDQFLTFAQAACDWIDRSFVSARGKNTADNPEEYWEYMSFKQGRGL